MKRNLSAFFHPKSVAVIGASKHPEKVGSIVLANILASGFRGKVYPVNPKGGTLHDRPVYEGIEFLPAGVDLAVVATPAETVISILNQLGRKQIVNVIVFSAGFSEMGSEGKLLQQEMKEIGRNFGMNILGPNCLGYLSTITPINTTFGQQLNDRGNLFLISQSGAIASSIFDWCQASGVGVANAITLGNKVDLDENDILEYLAETKHEAVPFRAGMAHAMPIGMYLESIKDGREFVTVCARLSQQHPLFLLKPGKSAGAKKAMQSHTGAIAGEDFILEAALEKAGVIRCDGIEDFFDLCRVFSFEDVPKGPRVAVISNAGGPAVISADLIEQNHLNLAELKPETKAELENYLPRAASLINPIDVLGDAMADRFEKALKTVLREETVDGVIVILTPQVMTQIEATAEVIGKLSYEYKKPILASFIGGTRIALGERVLNGYKIPVFRYPERAIYAFAKLWQWAKIRSRKISTVGKENEVYGKRQSEPMHTFEEISKVFRAEGIQVPPTERVESLAQAERFLAKHKGPMVLKIIDERLLHKFEFGAVELAIMTQAALQEAWKRLAAANRAVAKVIGRPGGIYAQVQVESGVELIAGVKSDISFGQVLMFGAGGGLANLIQDRNLLLLPTGLRQIQDLIEKAKVYPLIAGYRGSSGYDEKKLAVTLKALSVVAEKNVPYGELEINPLILNRSGAWAVDVKVIP